MRRHFYGVSAVVLGLWEATAFATHGRVPTITTVCHARRHPAVRLGIAAWLLGLGRHLLG